MDAYMAELIYMYTYSIFKNPPAGLDIKWVCFLEGHSKWIDI